MTTFSIDRDRLERYRAEADAARGASRIARDRVTEARLQLRDAKDEVERLKRSHGGGPYLASARNRVEAAQAEVARMAEAQSQGAGAREHATQLFACLEAYAQERAQ